MYQGIPARTDLDSITGYQVDPYLDLQDSPKTVASTPIEGTLFDGSSGKKRKSLKMRSDKRIPRSSSTPQMREQDHTMSESELDKKRNKLGYQRISIACAHCRRRKIRCLAPVGDAGDPQARCQNCVRLKKDCIYYPVEQQTAIESTQSTGSSRTGQDSMPSSVTSVSPPSHGILERPFEAPRDFAKFQPLPSNAPTAYGGPQLDAGNSASSQGMLSHPMRMTVNGRMDSFAPQDYNIRSHEASRTMWTGQGDHNYQQAPHTAIPTSIAPHDYWRPSAQSNTPVDFAPFPIESLPSGRSPRDAMQPFAHPYQRGEDMWTQHGQPHRSMSYSNVEEAPGHLPPFGAAFPANQRPQNPPMRYPSSLDVREAPVSSGYTASPHSAPPINTAMLPPFVANSPYLFHNDSSTSSASLNSNTAHASGWYGDSPYGLAQEDFESTDYSKRTSRSR